MRWTIPILVMTGLMLAAPANADEGRDPLRPIDSGTVTVTGHGAAPASPDIYGTVAINAGVTAYGARWRRVSAADESDPRVRELAAAAMAHGARPLERLTAVHNAVGRRIRWAADLDTYHVSDYWAQAGETLTRGVGDTEDIAILEMQVLKAAGFPARDIYLSVGRDRQRGADTLLLVRVGNQFFALDDRAAGPAPAQGRQQFVPIITLGKNSAWLHGRRVASRSGQARLLRASVSRSLAP